MANNPYVSKVALADGTVLIDLTVDTVAAGKMLAGTTAHDKSGAVVTGNIQDMAGQSITPTRSVQTIATSGKRLTGDIVVAAIPNTYYTAEEALNLLFPVDSIYMSTSSTAPSFGGTWTEITMPLSWDDVENGTRSYGTPAQGATMGTVHFWKRTA